MRAPIFYISLAALCAAILMQPACGSRYGEDEIPQVSVNINGDDNPEKIDLPDINLGQAAIYLTAMVKNIGRADLTISNIYLELEGNPYITIDWSSGIPNFPKMLAAGNELDYIQFQIVYQPEEIPYFVPSVLVVESDDPDYPVYKFTLNPPGDKPQVEVSPSSYTFLNATPSKPETQVFEITNKGTAPLRFDSVYLQSPDDEFTVLETPAPGTQVQPPSEQLDDKTSFKVRYQPKDDVVPDEAVVILKTNDPAQPEFQITVKSKVLLGKLVITYEDQAKGYVDFSEVLEENAVAEKSINLVNTGDGPIRIQGGSVEPDDDTPYTLFVQKPGEDAKSFGKNDVKSIKSQGSLDIIVKYTAPGPEGVDGELLVRYENPYQSEFSLPLVGGSAKPNFQIYPSQGTFQASNLQYHSDGDPISRTVVLANEGLAPVTINDLSLTLPKAFEGQPMNFELVSPPTMPMTLGSLELLAVEVRFLAEGDAVISKADLGIDYLDSTGTSTLWNIALAGYKQIPLPDADPINLPVANPGSTDEHAEATVGSEILLNGSKSIDGDAYIQQNGFTWYLAEKPVSSAVKLNAVAGSTTGFIPDRAGTYKIILFVQTEMVSTGENTKFGFVDYQNLWSDEVQLEIQVQ